MTETVSPATDAPPNDPLRAALSDPATRVSLLRHAHSRMRGLPFQLRAQRSEEAIDETFARAWCKREHFDADRSALGWLFGILSHVLLEQRRSSLRQPTQPEAVAATWNSLEVRLENPVEINELLASLDPEQANIIRLHFLEGLTHQESAELLGVSEPASRVRLARAMNAVRQLATKEGGQ